MSFKNLGTTIPQKMFSVDSSEEVSAFCSQNTLVDNEMNEKFDITIPPGSFLNTFF